MTKNKNFNTILAISLVILFVSNNTLFAQSEKKTLGSKEPWEVVVAFPGQVIFFPVKVFLKGTMKTVEYFDESKIIPKTIDLMSDDNGKWAFSPIYSSTRGGGLNFFHFFNNNESKFDLSFSRGIRQRQRYSLGLKDLNLFGESVSTNFEINYQLRSDEKFFGLGNNSIFVNKNNYAHEQLQAQLTLSKSLFKDYSIFINLGIEKNNIHSGKDPNIISITSTYNPSTLKGLGEGVKLSSTLLSLERDTRDLKGHPSRGSVSKIEAGYFWDFDSDKYNFFQFSFDYRKYVELFYSRSIVLRVAGKTVTELDNSSIPFYYLSELGHQETIRGFERGRFRDRDMLLASIEYRYPIWANGDAFFFFDAGQSSSDILDDISFYDFNKGYGGGINIWTQNTIATQFVVGKSTDGFRIYLNLDKKY